MYGENVGAIRDELAALLRMHRIQQRIGGGNRHVPVTTTPTERADIGALIQRYRHGILIWCRQAVTAATYGPHHSGPRQHTPGGDLHRRLSQVLDSASTALPTLDELTTPAAFNLVEHWRNAARFAALGEHDLTGAVTGGLDFSKSRMILGDASEVVRALLVLDLRYEKVPGWEPFRGARGLRQVAEACAYPDPPDASVQSYGWRPSSRLLAGPARSGMAGVLQAQHNLLVHLRELPSVLNLRRIAQSQREVSALASTRLAGDDPDLAETWAHRSGVYTELGRRLRDIDGRAGTGGLAASEAANAVSRLRAFQSDGPVDKRDLERLDRLFTASDRRVVDAVRTGATERIYFARAKVPRLDTDDGRPVHQVRERFKPMLQADQRDLTDCFDSGRSRSAPPPDDGNRSRFRWAAGIDYPDAPDQAPLSL